MKSYFLALKIAYIIICICFLLSLIPLFITNNEPQIVKVDKPQIKQESLKPTILEPSMTLEPTVTVAPKPTLASNFMVASEIAPETSFAPMQKATIKTESLPIPAPDITTEPTYSVAANTVMEVEPEPIQIRVCSWNIRSGNRRTEKQQNYLLKLQPDIIALQEVKCNKKTNNIEGYEDSELIYNSFAPSIRNSFGNAIFSSYELSETEIFYLYNGDSYEKRLLMKNTITIQGKTISIYNTHLNYTSIRSKQLKEVKDILDADPTEYKILMGDFNISSFKPNNFKIFDDYIVIFEKGVDNIIITKNIEVELSKIVSTRLSDHNLIYADLILK